MVQSDHMQIKAMEMQEESGWEATVRNRKDLPPPSPVTGGMWEMQQLLQGKQHPQGRARGCSSLERRLEGLGDIAYDDHEFQIVDNFSSWKLL